MQECRLLCRKPSSQPTLRFVRRFKWTMPTSNWVHEHHPELDALYRQIYSKRDRTYWTELDGQLRTFCETENLPYVRNDDSVRAKHGEPPVVVNYFYHETITKSAQKQQKGEIG